jgi:hypothetical protein
MIVFFVQALLYVAMTLSVFGGLTNKTLIGTVGIFFAINQIVVLLYGIDTNQIGFILLVAFQFFLILLTYIFVNGSEVGGQLYENK